MGERTNDLLSWLAASLVTAGIVVMFDRREHARRPAPELAPAAPSPAQEPLTLQRQRATERGRGRKARSPGHIPGRGWYDILMRTYAGTQEHRLLALAAGVAFYSLLALFPGIAAAVSCYALVADAGTIAKHLSIAAGIVPTDVLNILNDQITRMAAKSDGHLTSGFLVGLAIALWSANAGIKAIFDALNIIYDETEKRSLVRLQLVSLLFTICAIAAGLSTLGAIVVFPLILAALGIPEIEAPLIAYLRWPAMFAVVIFGLGILYRFGPSRRPARWRWMSVGSVFAALAWLVVSSLFSWYLGNFASYDATYGTLGAVVGMMTWMWLSITVMLVGAQLNAEMEHQTARDSTVGPEKPLGSRGAVMADTVGAAQG